MPWIVGVVGARLLLHPAEVPRIAVVATATAVAAVKVFDELFRDDGAALIEVVVLLLGAAASRMKPLMFRPAATPGVLNHGNWGLGIAARVGKEDLKLFFYLGKA